MTEYTAGEGLLPKRSGTASMLVSGARITYVEAKAEECRATRKSTVKAGRKTLDIRACTSRASILSGYHRTLAEKKKLATSY